MNHIIVGTAGHIDHGKTTLIKAITGRETDRLKEEQDRGISIELGFTYFDLPSGQRAGIIDVPGHEKFIKNMLAGAIGIDLVLLVVAADEGIMPQTLEHLSILDLLGTKKGFIVLTKCDLVEEEWIELVEQEVREEVKGSFLENSPIIQVSSTSKQGIDELIQLIDKESNSLEIKDINDMPRMPVDRIFTVSGFGTVVTGTLLSGKFQVGDEVQVYPENITSRVRTLQVHDEDAEMAYGGQRVAMNLHNVKKEQIHRGSIIAPIGVMKDSMMVDVKVKLLKSLDRPIENRTRLKLYIGSEEVQCRIILLDRDVLNPGEETYAQLRLEDKIVSKIGDRFILRFYSPMFTVGGGRILEPNPNKKKQYDEKTLKELKLKDKGDKKDIIENLIKNNSPKYLNTKDLSQNISIFIDAFNIELKKLEEEERVIVFHSTDYYPLHMEFINKLKDDIIKTLEIYHSNFPLRVGMSKEEIRNKHIKVAKPKLAEELMAYMIENYVDQENNLIRIKDYKPAYTPELKDIREKVLKELKDFNIPKKDELKSSLDVNLDKLEDVLNALIREKEIIKINEEIYIRTNLYNEALEKLVDFINSNGSIAAGEFRDLLNTNRRIAIGLLEYFDNNKITKRLEDKRILI